MKSRSALLSGLFLQRHEMLHSTSKSAFWCGIANEVRHSKWAVPPWYDREMNRCFGALSILPRTG